VSSRRSRPTRLQTKPRRLARYAALIRRRQTLCASQYNARVTTTDMGDLSGVLGQSATEGSVGALLIPVIPNCS